jgi:excisionase family DNA binding protein
MALRSRRWSMYELMNGETVDLAGITEEARAYLDDIDRDAAAGVSYFDLELRVKGPSAFTTRKARGFVTAEVLRNPVYRVANDLVARVGIQQGKVAPPRDAKPSDLLSVPEAARLIGQTRQNLNAAISRGSLPARKIGETWVLRLEDVRVYKERAAARPAPGRPLVARDGNTGKHLVLRADRDGRIETRVPSQTSSKKRGSTREK